MSMPSMQGLWTFPSTQHPGENDFMFIDEVRGRIVLFSTIVVNPVKRTHSMHWFRRDSATSIAARLWGYDEWRIYTFKIQDDQIIWPVAGHAQAWRQLPFEHYPEWLESRIAQAYTRMDEAESKESVPSSG